MWMSGSTLNEPPYVVMGVMTLCHVTTSISTSPSQDFRKPYYDGEGDAKIMPEAPVTL